MRARMLRAVTAVVGGTTLACALSACGDGQDRQVPPPEPSASVVTPSPSPTPSPTPGPGTVAPAWLGTRVLTPGPDGVIRPQATPRELRRRRFTLPDTLDQLPGSGFASRVTSPAPADVIARSTWSSGCPVAATDLAWIRLSFWGFDDERHTGELLVAAAERWNIVRAFHTLYDLRFPIEQMHVTSVAENNAPPTGDGNNTSAFNCRPVRGATSWSEHAYGLAVDVNPFQNPYVKGSGASEIVLPELATSYVDRSWRRPGMILPDSPAVRAFSQVGWSWGGAWHSLQDLQHFSLRNR